MLTSPKTNKKFMLNYSKNIALAFHWSSVLEPSRVKYWSVLSTHIVINISNDTRSRLDLHSTDISIGPVNTSWTSIDWLIHIECPQKLVDSQVTVNWNVDWMLTKYWSGCQSSVTGGYQWAVDCRCLTSTHDPVLLQCDYSNQGHPTKFSTNLTNKNRWS